MQNSIDEVLEERGSIYGTYKDGVTCRATIMQSLETVYSENYGTQMPYNLRVVFSDLVLKLMRAASGPEHKDSWLDLAGYSKLINGMVEGDNNVFNSRGH